MPIAIHLILSTQSSACDDYVIALAQVHSAITGFVSSPMRSIATVTVSPGFRCLGGLREKPTPSGVPVSMIVPGNKVVPSERNDIICGTENIISAVLESCTVSPFTVQLMRKLSGLGISEVETSRGP